MLPAKAHPWADRYQLPRVARAAFALVAALRLISAVRDNIKASPKRTMINVCIL